MQIKPGAPTRLQHPPDRRRPKAIAAEAARKAPKCLACLLAHTVLHPYGWSKQGGATDTKWHLEGETLRSGPVSKI
jgi:hypothetical protein